MLFKIAPLYICTVITELQQFYILSEKPPNVKIIKILAITKFDQIKPNVTKSGQIYDQKPEERGKYDFLKASPKQVSIFLTV